MVAMIGSDAYNERAASKTYFPNGYSMSLAMRRARAQYFWRNVRGLLLACAFGGGVYWYSIQAVSQDDFSDLTALVPSAEERAHIASIEDLNTQRAARLQTPSSPSSSSSLPSPPTSPSEPGASTQQTDAEALRAVTPTGPAGFGLAQQALYYWPRGGLVAPALRRADGAVDWSAKRV